MHRSLCAVALLVSLSAAAAPQASPAKVGVRGVYVGGSIGPNFNLTGQDSPPPWWRGTLRLEVELVDLGAATFSLVVPIGLQYLSYTRQFWGLDYTTSSFAFDVLPSARANVPLVERLRLYTEVGLGFGGSSTTTQLENTDPQTGSSNAFGVRFALGIDFELVDRLFAFLEPMAFHWMSWDAGPDNPRSSAVTWSVMVGAVYKL